MNTKQGNPADENRLAAVTPGSTRSGWLVNLLLLGLWITLYRAVFPYLAIIFTAEEFRTNQIVLLSVVILIAIQTRKGEFELDWLSPPRLYLPALVVAGSASGLYLIVERFLDINTFSATLFGLASYGMVGLWMTPQRWRQGMPAALLAVGTLPFGDHMQTFIGYPLRLITAQIVQSGLHWLGITTIGVDTILVFETGISKIDLPCSGVKSLWTGALFFFAATWIERRPVNLRWLLAAGFFTLLLTAANLGRVAILVTVGQAASMRLLAEMLHVPLGVLGFAGACAAAVWMLRWAGEFSSARCAGIPGSPVVPKPAWFTPLLAATILALALLYTPRPETALAQAAQIWNFSEELHAEPWALSQEERNWLEISGVEQAERWRFTWQDLSGSMLFIRSTSWRAHHRPERCFEVYGLQVGEAATMLVRQAFPIRALSLGSSRQPDLYTAVYWLQSANLTTDDYASRIWADLAPQRETWVLVTILFDQVVELHTPQAGEFYLAVQETVHNQLQGGSIP